MAEEYECEQCKDTGWADVKRADGRIEKVLCYCHPLVRSGKIRALEGNYYLTRYIDMQQSKQKRKKGKRGNVPK